MATKRLPMLFTIESRDISALKDSLLANAFIETESSESPYVVKRPGRKNEVTGAGTANGIFIYGAKVYSWDSSRANNNPVITLVSSLT